MTEITLPRVLYAKQILITESMVDLDVVLIVAALV